MAKEMNELKDHIAQLNLKNSDLELRVLNMVKNEKRLLEMLRNSQEYKEIVDIADSKKLIKKKKMQMRRLKGIKEKGIRAMGSNRERESGLKGLLDENLM